MPPADVLLLSNGHGEDLSGALLGAVLMARGVSVQALPLVGHGHAYRQRGIPVLGPTREFRTGGLGFTSFQGQMRELLDGQMAHVVGSLLRLWRQRGRHRLVVAVGDLVAVLGALLGGRRTAVYLVAYSSHYEGRLRLPWPCGWLLRRRAVAAVWSRDALTAEDLSQQLRRPVHFLGNPFLDAALPPGALGRDVSTPPTTGDGSGDESDDGSGTEGEGHRPQLLALLPGSRLPEARQNLALMLRMLALLPSALRQPGRLRVRAVLVQAFDAAQIRSLAGELGWQLSGAGRLCRDALEVELVWGDLGGTLSRADLVVAMAGTASEQAVGLGKPVLQLVGAGPQFTAGFAEAQRRLLGPGVCCVPWSGDQTSALGHSARLAGALLQELGDPTQGPARRRNLARTAEERIGRPGGTARLAAAIMDLLN